MYLNYNHVVSRLNRVAGMLGGRQSAHICFKDQRPATFGDAELVVKKGQSVCEPAVWSRWQHRGDLTAGRLTSFLEFLISDVAELISRYPVIHELGSVHSKRMIASLNERVRDLFTSEASFTTNAI